MRIRRRPALIALLLVFVASGGAWLTTALVGPRGQGPGEGSDALPSDVIICDMNDVITERSRQHTRQRNGVSSGSDHAPERPPPDAEIEPVRAQISTSLLDRSRRAAEQAVESVRDDIHRDKIDVVWSPSSALPPPDGAEVVVLRGYLDHTLFRVVWGDGVAAGTWLDPSRGLRADAARSGARTFTVDADRFVVAWTAARWVLGARAERRVPLPDDRRLGGRRSWSSHESYLVAFLREPESPHLHAFEQHGARYESDDVRRWDQIRDRAIHALLGDLVDPDHMTPTPLDVWLPFFHATLTELGREGDLERGNANRLLLQTVLRTLGDTGDARTLELLDTLSQRVSTPELAPARLRLRLRVRWDAAEAESAIVPVYPSERRDAELAAWVRARYRIVDPEGYREMLLRHLLDGDLDTKLIRATQDELLAHYPDALRGAMRALLPHQDAQVRVEAALTLVGLDDLDESDAQTATAVLRAAAADPGIRRPYWQRRGDWPRALAIRHLASRGEWGPDELRRRILVRQEDGALVELIETLLADAGEPLTHVEARDAYRGVLDGRRDAGMLIAIRRLIELDDRPSFERMGEILGAMAVPPEEGEEDLVGTSHRRFTVPGLAERL